MIFLWTHVLVIFLLMPPSLWALSKKEEEVRFFPSYALREEGGWRVKLRGWVYEPETDSMARDVLVHSLLAAVPLDADRTLFEERVRRFLVDGESGVRLKVRLEGTTRRLPRSGDHGAVRDDFAVAGASTALPGTWWTLIAVLGRKDSREMSGEILLVGEEGLSVVSDVDDTIKISSVTDRQELVANTFLRPWRAVPGMAALYQGWADEGAVFHYLSNSPWPLDEEMNLFLAREGFPKGLTHLRPLSAKTLLSEEIFAYTDSHKRTVLEELFAAFPHRRFILVGDSGERDPEIYGDIARAYPERVKGIFIRKASPDVLDRWGKAFHSLPPEQWTLFEEPGTLVQEEKRSD